EIALEQLNATLEQRVAARTTELQASNVRLAAEIEARKRAEDRFRRVVEFAPSAMVMTDREGIIEMVNVLAEQIFHYNREELLGQSIEMLVPERFRDLHPDLRATFHAAPGSRPMGEGRDLYGIRKDGLEVPVEIALNPVETDEGLMVLAAIVDISDRKQKEYRIQTTLRENMTLLAEVHHRVKNNLQIVHSLLDLQSTQTDDPAVRAILENSMGRIQSMSLIHQTLYQSKNFARVALDEVLQTLISSIANSYGVDEERVKMVIDVKSVELPITQAIPCGLIVNELVTNAFKYAFPEKRSGAMRVELSINDDERVLLEISDNGVGLSPDIDMDNLTSLGLELVAVLSEQIGAELTIQRANPTRFSIRFALRSE
ncbi:MAG TPA: histidine kinase dimerization/phosphoacceptor domain -containing protein, partial [Spongiibacteraceae bacterium]|nr:histidine kinase dimerization/phosphoacceptor domain -containing protein [Spongiibacteraceae bacterium]